MAFEQIVRDMDLSSIDMSPPPEVHPLDVPTQTQTTTTPPAIPATRSTGSLIGQNACLGASRDPRKKPGPKPKENVDLPLPTRIGVRGVGRKNLKNVPLQPCLPVTSMPASIKNPPESTLPRGVGNATTSISSSQNSTQSWDPLATTNVPASSLQVPAASAVTPTTLSTTQYLFRNNPYASAPAYTTQQSVESANSIFKTLIIPSIPETMTFSNSVPNPNGNGYVLAFPIENITLNLEQMIYSQLLQTQFNNRFVEYMNSFPSITITTLELHQALINVLNSMNFF